MPAAITRKPSVSVGLRPQRSTRPIAIKVASTLVRPTITVPHICSAGVGITRQFEDFRRVIHDDVHPGELLHYPHIYTLRNTARRKLLFSLNSAQLLRLTRNFHGFHPVHVLLPRWCHAGAAARVRHQQTAFGSKPTWAVCRKKDTNQQQNCRDDNHTQHPAAMHRCS